MRASVIRRLAAVTAESPRMTIAKNILAYQGMHAATNEAALAEASKPIGNLDVANLPPSIAELQGYLSSSAAASSAGFTRNPNAWQNKDFIPMTVDAAGNTWFWPFIVGGV